VDTRFYLRKQEATMPNIKPTPKQLEFLSWEMGAFFHFGIRTFYEGHNDWDHKPMPLSGFNPAQLDCDSWIKTVRDAGMKYAILVCKHHDGFANWPSAYTNYHVGFTPWKAGKGDVVAEFVAACRKYDIKVGLYYSPAEEGYTERSAREHDDYFINQIGELLGNYGKIDYLWFDGCGSEGHEYDKARIIAAIRGLQPEILVFNMWDPDTRWVGNEGGVAGPDNVNVVTDVDFSVMTTEKDALSQQKFLPAECDFMMRSRRWFYSEYDVHTVKSVEELVGLYYYSVGCGANFLVNIGPDRRGLLPDVDAARLLAFGREIARRFSRPIPARTEKTERGLRVVFEQEQMVNHLVLSEDLTEGESIEAFTVQVTGGVIYSPKIIYTGKAVGHKRIVIFPPILASALAAEVTESRGAFALDKAEAFMI
jgi:alpha-L-fucosidase